MNIFSILLRFALFLFLLTPAHSQTFNLTVVNGYGSGSYTAGDTVNIWSAEYDTTKTFDVWTGDAQFLLKPKEWHTTLIMPSQDVTVTASIVDMPSHTINYEQIMGLNNLKNVYSCFPANMKGLIYLFHGTSGSASNWINFTEYRSFVNAAIADSFGIIITEAEEITLNTDLNGDGKLRWHTFPIDTVNGIDYANIRIITDTFINRGNITQSTPKFSVGMSNGGSYSNTISFAYNYVAGVSYCASSAQIVFDYRDNPFAFRMAKYDDHPEVGPQGNYEAWQNDSTLAARGICHDYQLQDKQPIYPERFARIPGVSVATSQAIFNELLTNNELDSENYALHSDSITNHIIANPLNYPTIITLPASVLYEFVSQIAASNMEHKFYSDLNYETLDFLNNLCSTSGIEEILSEDAISMYPNPANEFVSIQTDQEIAEIGIFNAQGALMQHTQTTNININELASGVYFVHVVLTNGRVWTGKLLKE